MDSAAYFAMSGVVFGLGGGGQKNQTISNPLEL